MEDSTNKVRILITSLLSNRLCNIANSLSKMEIFDNKQKEILLYGPTQSEKQKIRGSVMDLEDCMEPNVTYVNTNKIEDACKDIDFAFITQSHSGSTLNKKSIAYFKELGTNLGLHAKKGVKVIVVSDPAHLIMHILVKYAVGLGPENFTTLNMINERRAHRIIADKINVEPSKVHNVYIWGCDSDSQVIDARFAWAETESGNQKVVDILGEDYIHRELYEAVISQGALSGDNNFPVNIYTSTTVRHLTTWISGTEGDHVISMGVIVPQSSPYGIKPGIVFSFPCRVKDGKVQIVDDIPLNDWMRDMLKKTETKVIQQMEEIDKLL